MKKRVVNKSFRLFDFHTYDGSINENSGSDDSSLEEHSNGSSENNGFIIQMFGINENGDTCCLYVKDYKPFFFIKVADNWTKATIKRFLSYLNERTKLEYNHPDYFSKKTFNDIENCELVQHKKLYGFSGGKEHNFIKISFQNYTAMKKCKNLWYKYEHNSKGEYIG